MKNILLVILPNALVDSSRKLEVSVQEYDELLAAVIEKFALPQDTFLSHVVADGGTPKPLSSLDEFLWSPALDEVQAWSPAQMAAAAAAAAEAESVAAEEARLVQEFGATATAARAHLNPVTPTVPATVFAPRVCALC